MNTLIENKENYGKVFNLNKVDEMYRIDLVSQTYDFISRQQLKSLNLNKDARCVDIGAGTGSMALWLSDQPEYANGEIIAMDRFVKMLKKRVVPSHNLKIIQHDITNNEYFGQFDLVNIRFVLMHLKDRVEILNKISSWVKPGGWLVVSDIIDLTTKQSDNPLYKSVMTTMWDTLIKTIGTDKDWCHTLISQFKSLGFNNIKNEVYLPPISKNSPMSEFWYLTWKDLHKSLIEVGNLEPDILEQAENDLINGEVTALSPGMYTCMGQKL